MSFYKSIRPYIFKLDCELAHSLVNGMSKACNFFPPILSFISEKTKIESGLLYQEIDENKFYNPVLLAAGFDKNATMLKSMLSLGFGALELGAITPRPQVGNPKPRIWRHIEEESIQNAMGFNNDGLNVVLNRIKPNYPFAIPLGINIGKNKDTTQENAIKDYIELALAFTNYSDYLSVNISSPNTPNLRDLQNEGFIQELCIALREVYSKPIYIKLSPDLSIDSMLKLIEVAISNKISGIIITNTTLDYSVVKNPQEIGGISGKALSNKSLQILKEVSKVYAKKTTIISSGGIYDARSAYERICYGANLISIYSALIFEGPMIVRDINMGLLELLKSDGFSNITQAVGAKL